MSGSEFNPESEIVQIASDYLKRADNLRINFDEALRKDELHKASEMLWGIFTCYVNALALVESGKSIVNHGLMVKFAEEFAKTKQDEKLAGAIRSAEMAHANFYHGFIKDKEELKPLFSKLEREAT